MIAMATTPYREPLEREPWKSAPPFAVRLLRHRLALHTVVEIAAHYEMTDAAVRKQLGRLLAHLRDRCPLPLHDVSALLVVAERDGLAMLPLSQTGQDTAAELPEAGCGA